MILIKRYLNGRLFDTDKNCYVKLNDLTDYIKEGKTFKVITNKSKEDITKDIYSQCALRVLVQSYDSEDVIRLTSNIIKEKK